MILRIWIFSPLANKMDRAADYIGLAVRLTITMAVTSWILYKVVDYLDPTTAQKKKAKKLVSKTKLWLYFLLLRVII